MTALVWGFIGLTVVIIGVILGLSLKLISEMKKKSDLQRKLDSTEVEVKGLEETVEMQTDSITRLKKGLEVLRNELVKTDNELSLTGVADRLKFLLSEEQTENGQG